MPKFKNSNTIFWVSFKQCELILMKNTKLMINAIIIRRLIQVSNPHRSFLWLRWWSFASDPHLVKSATFTSLNQGKLQGYKALLNWPQGRQPLFRGSLWFCVCGTHFWGIFMHLLDQIWYVQKHHVQLNTPSKTFWKKLPQRTMMTQPAPKRVMQMLTEVTWRTQVPPAFSAMIM